MKEEQIIHLATNITNSYFQSLSEEEKRQLNGSSYADAWINFFDVALGKTKQYSQYLEQRNNRQDISESLDSMVLK